MHGFFCIHHYAALALDLVAEQTAHGLAPRFSGMVFREGDFYAVMTGLAERVDFLLGFACFDHVMKLLVISILGNEFCLLFTGNREKNSQHNNNYGDKEPVTFLKFHRSGLFPRLVMILSW